ncbi:LAGLIDADG family homing endonuclease [Clostridioides difficile]
MDNKTLKIIYKLRTGKIKEREIKKQLKEKYGVNCTMPELKRFLNNIPITYEKYSEIDKRRILHLYKRYINTEKLIKYLNEKYQYDLTINRIRDLACRNGVKKDFYDMYKQSFINRNDEYNIVKLYEQGFTANEIAKLYGYKTRNSILQKLDKFNVERRNWNKVQSEKKSYYNFSMEFLDDEYKAYFLGLILTDGYVNEERGYIGIDLSDKDVIEFLCDYLKTSYSIIKSEFKDKYRIILYGKELVEEMKRLSVTARKTFSLEGPNLYDYEKRYLPYIIRGIIDGDGWIRKDGKEFFISSASNEFIKWCGTALKYLGFEGIEERFIANDFRGIYIIRTAKKYNLEVLRNKIYNKPFGMNRKYKLLL